jgi:hypothetical protein
MMSALMESSPRHTARFVLGAVFLGAVAMFFEAAGQPVPLPVPRPSLPLVSRAVVNEYRPVPAGSPHIKAALRAALDDQKAKNRAAVKLLGVLSAEHQSGASEKYRLCLSLDRRGRPDTARVIVQQRIGKARARGRWSVALWAWGACG